MKNIFFTFVLMTSTPFIIACCGQEERGTSSPIPHLKGEEMITDKLQIVDIIEGTGDEAKKGDIVEVHYTGTLLNGKKFDSSLDRNQTFRFKIGEARVIKGWDEGVPGMKVGGKRELTIPSEMAYGSRGAGSIPPNSPLKFEIQLISIKK